MKWDTRTALAELQPHARHEAWPPAWHGRRVLLVASAGGHWLELCRLADAFRGFDCQFVCTTGALVAPVGDHPVMVVADGSRRQISRLLRTALSLRRIMRDFRPDIVISTGAAPGGVALAMAWLHGARTVWIESIASRDTLSLSGIAVRRFADLFLTQWPDLRGGHADIDYFGQVL